MNDTHQEKSRHEYTAAHTESDEAKFHCARCLKGFVVYDAYLAHYRANECEEVEGNGR
jgi:hypothetical protein